MARPTLNVDVEYAEIEIAGVWYSVNDVNIIIDRLRNIMLPRDWLKLKADQLQHIVGILDNVIMLGENGYTKEQMIVACRSQRDEFRKQIEEEAKS